MSQYMSITSQEHSDESETPTSFSFPNTYSQTSPSPSPQTHCSSYIVTPSTETPSYVYNELLTPNSCSSQRSQNTKKQREITGQFPSINLEENFVQTPITRNSSITITPKKAFHDRSRPERASTTTTEAKQSCNLSSNNNDDIEIVFDCNPCVNEAELEELTLNDFGYKKEKFLIDTLQGSVYIARVLNTHKSVSILPETVVIKRTSKKLHNQRITILKDGSKVAVQENIIREAHIMKTLNQNSPPCSMIRYFQFFEDDLNYYLVMENGGSSFFQFVVKCHALIEEGKLQITEWRKQCKFMFAQCVQFISWMHSKGFCNLDISLENLLISHDCYFNEKTGKLNKCYIKFIDFGLSEQFNIKRNSNFECAKFVGKTLYKSPQVYKRRHSFDARKADIWSLGVVLFMMMVGCPPYNKPSDDDVLFGFLKRGQTLKLLQQWGRVKYLTGHSLDLLNHIFVINERQRYDMDQVCQHPWILQYFMSKYAEKRVSNVTINRNNRKNVVPSLMSLYSPNLSIRSKTSKRKRLLMSAAGKHCPKIVIPQSNSSISDICAISNPLPPSPERRVVSPKSVFDQ